MAWSLKRNRRVTQNQNRDLQFKRGPVWSMVNLEPRILLAGDIGASDVGTDAGLCAATSSATTTTHAPTVVGSIATPTKAMLPVELASHSANTISQAKSIVFIDSEVQDIRVLKQGVVDGAEVVLLDSARDGLTQISEHLSLRRGIESLHLVAHGDSGQLQLGNRIVDGNHLRANAAQLAQWTKSLTDDADILIYGCQTGAGASGAAFALQLAKHTGADVAMSIDQTGNGEAADWELERTVGTIEASVVFDAKSRAEFSGVLDAPSVAVQILEEVETPFEPITQPFIEPEPATTSAGQATARGPRLDVASVAEEVIGVAPALTDAVAVNEAPLLNTPTNENDPVLAPIATSVQDVAQMTVAEATIVEVTDAELPGVESTDVMVVDLAAPTDEAAIVVADPVAPVAQPVIESHVPATNSVAESTTDIVLPTASSNSSTLESIFDSSGKKTSNSRAASLSQSASATKTSTTEALISKDLYASAVVTPTGAATAVQAEVAKQSKSELVDPESTKSAALAEAIKSATIKSATKIVGTTVEVVDRVSKEATPNEPTNQLPARLADLVVDEQQVSMQGFSHDGAVDLRSEETVLASWARRASESIARQFVEADGDGALRMDSTRMLIEDVYSRNLLAVYSGSTPQFEIGIADATLASRNNISPLRNSASNQSLQTATTVENINAELDVDLEQIGIGYTSDESVNDQPKVGGFDNTLKSNAYWLELAVDPCSVVWESPSGDDQSIRRIHYLNPLSGFDSE